MNTILSFYIIIKRICKILFIKMLVLSRVYESRFANFLGLKHIYRSLGPSLLHVRTLSESNPKKNKRIFFRKKAGIFKSFALSTSSNEIQIHIYDEAIRNKWRLRTHATGVNVRCDRTQ